MRFTSSKLLTLALLGSIFLAALVTAAPRKNKIGDEQEAEEFMKELDVRYSHECNLEMKSRWEYIVDVMDPDKETAANEAAVRYLNFKGEAAVNSSKFDYSGFDSIELYRRFRFLSKQGPGALDSADLTEFKDRQSKMETIYSTATICDYHDPTICELTLEPDVEYIMATSDNWDELRYVWDQWREVSGKLMREDFIRFVELSNKAATLDGFTDTSMYWLNGYTVDDREATSFEGAETLSQDQFKEMVDTVWQEVSTGLYKKLHSWVRWRMSELYPEHIDLKGPMPANILGNMWAQDWVNVADHVMPFPEFPSFDVSESMVQNGWDIQRMFESAQDFFESVNLFPMTQDFWDKSVVNQTAWGKIMLCHASAEDFCLGPDASDYRIKMCTEVNMEDLVTVHHEMGHIEYFMAYKNQPHVFRDSANPGFHEAIGDLIALSVSTPSHMENVLHLSPGKKTETAPSASVKYTDDEKRDLNFLMRMALEKIAFLPFGYLIDKFRWGVFDGSIPIDQMNAGWWQLREDLQGITPPGQARGEEFFDAGAKYHVPANVPYIRYFVSFIVQFQFHAHLCEVAGHTGPLHTCDIYNNTAAGNVLMGALERGFSEPWPIVLQDLGGSLDMDPQAIISYFDPLIKFLDEELANAEQCIGWGDDCVTSVGNVLSDGGHNGNPNSLDAASSTPTSPDPTTTPAPTSDPTSDSPVTSDPTPVSPVTSDPTSDLPVTSDSTSDSPMTSDPTPVSPVTSDSTPVSPVTSDSTPVSPVTSDSTPVSPVTSEPPTTTEDPSDENIARQEMEAMDAEMTMAVQGATLSDWSYETDLTEENKITAINDWQTVKKRFGDNFGSVISYFNYTYFGSDLQRQFELQKNKGVAALTNDELTELTDHISGMVTSYSKKICPVTNTNCDLNTAGIGIYALDDEMANTESSFEDLSYYWQEWRRVSSKEMKGDFQQYITLENKAAKDNEFSNAGLMWLDPYTDDEYTSTTFQSEIASLWEKTKPLYQKLHAYVLHKLKGHHVGKIADAQDLIPAHILGDMWGENWENIYELVAPYPDAKLPDISGTLTEKVGNTTEMFDMAEDFFLRIGLLPMTDTFRNSSIFEREDRDMVCQASAWDFYDVYSEDFDPQAQGDFRIKMCANTTQKDFLRIHHEMGHVQYMMAYSRREEANGSLEIMPLVFRDGANPAFHEAIGDAIGLTVSSPSYLQMIEDQLNETVTSIDYDDYQIMTDHNTTINFLLKTALSKITVLPYAYILDAWRWDVFADNNANDDFNRRWWNLRIKEQGIAPPTKRMPNSEFDAGSKYDVAVSVPYIWRFVSQILQFEFHNKLCDILNSTSEVPSYHDCRIDDLNKTAGEELKMLMSSGRSLRWQDVLDEFLGAGNYTGMDAQALLDYFEPLDEFLTKYLKDNGLTAEWDPNQIDTYMDKEVEEISAVVPIVVGVVLACMVAVVIIAYFVGQKKQSKKRKALKAKNESHGLDNLGMENKEDDKESDKEDDKSKHEEEEDKL